MKKSNSNNNKILVENKEITDPREIIFVNDVRKLGLEPFIKPLYYGKTSVGVFYDGAIADLAIKIGTPTYAEFNGLGTVVSPQI